MTDGVSAATRVQTRRDEERRLQRMGFLRCTTYMGNLARMNGIPCERGPGVQGPHGDDWSDWIPAWFEWHMIRFQGGYLQHVPQRERLEQARELQNDKQRQLLLLIETQLTGGTLYDPAADISTDHAVQLLREELKSE